MNRVLKREKAKRDLEEFFVYVVEENLELDEHFLVSAEESFELLATMQFLGTPEISILKC